ncbi:hypothetical protein ABTX24_13445 [Nocardioides sp. NPDC127514]
MTLEFDWPAIERVNTPVDVETGEPNGVAIRMRRLGDKQQLTGSPDERA